MYLDLSNFSLLTTNENKSKDLSNNVYKSIDVSQFYQPAKCYCEARRKVSRTCSHFRKPCN